MSNDMDEQIKLPHVVVDVMDRAYRKIVVTLLRYSVDKPEAFYAQARLVARKKGDEKFEQTVYVNFTFQEFTNQLDVEDSVYEKDNINQPVCKVL